MKKRVYACAVVIISLVLPLIWSVNCSGQGRFKDRFKNLPRKRQEPATAKASYAKVNIIGETAKMGGFDSAIEYDKGGAVGWLVYTAIEFPNMSTHLAKTTDHGRTWQYVTTINSSIPGKMVIDGKTVQGLWRNEVPTIVHDPDDPGGQWKLFSHKYFIKAPYRDYRRGKPIRFMYIAYKYAPTPEKLASAEEIVLFGAGPSPVGPKKARYNLNNFHPDLSKSGMYTEPGSLYKDGVLYLSLAAVGKDRKDNRTFLLASYDHGKTWKYLGTLTDYKDATAVGCTILTASSLVQEKGRTFLLIAPVFKEGKKGVHRGTYIFEFEDISRAKLKRDGRGRLVVHKYLRPSIKSQNAGESDYDEHNTAGGIVMPQLDSSVLKRGVDPRNVESFKIFSTKEKIVD